VAGAVAVVISLLYLSAQIRHGNKVSQAAAQESIANATRDFTKALAQDVELYRIWDLGVEDFDALEDSDRGRFVLLAFQFAKIYESAHYHYSRGLLGEASWEGWRSVLAHYFHAPGWKKYWALREDLYSPDFRDYVKDLPTPEIRASAGRLPAAP
jgi:hypothetical protein